MPATVRANVPDEVMGEPATEIRPPVKVWATLVTVPETDAFQVLSPAKYVLLDGVPVAASPVDGTRPVQCVSVPDDGVPSAPLNVTKAPADPTLMPRAVRTPVPVVVVAGAAPAPPPIIRALAARRADDAHADVLLKYGTPPEVPATVRAKVPADVIGEPLTEIRPPVKDWATLVTVPVVGVCHVGAPAAAEVKTCPDVPTAV